jgi:hypothetical protein
MRGQRRLDWLTRRWWLYPAILVVFFLPPYATGGYDPQASTDLIGATLAAPVIFSLPWLMPVSKVLTLAAVVGVLALGNRARRPFDGYVALAYLAIAIFQNTAQTEAYGLVVLLGNVAVVLLVALFWIWETVAGVNDFSPRRRPLWRWWVAPLALLAFLSPIDPATMAPDFSPLRPLTNESCLTFCMVTPVFLAMLTLFHPSVNLATMRVTGFAGILLGIVNMLTWFVLEPSGWWMGVLHLPLLTISLVAFVSALRR